MQALQLCLHISWCSKQSTPGTKVVWPLDFRGIHSKTINQAQRSQCKATEAHQEVLAETNPSPFRSRQATGTISALWRHLFQASGMLCGCYGRSNRIGSCGGLCCPWKLSDGIQALQSIGCFRRQTSGDHYWRASLRSPCHKRCMAGNYRSTLFSAHSATGAFLVKTTAIIFSWSKTEKTASGHKGWVS